MIRRAKLRRSLFCWLVLSPLLALVLFPYLVMLSTALKPTAEVMSYPPHWLPQQWSVASFAAMWQQAHLGLAIANSIVISGGSTLLALLVAVPAAYAMARLRFRAKPAFRALLAGDADAGAGAADPRPVPPRRGHPLRQRHAGQHAGGRDPDLRGVPDRLRGLDALRLFRGDPAGYRGSRLDRRLHRLQAVRRIFLPLAVPAVAVSAFVAFIAGWNEYVVALTMLRDADKQTVTLQVVNLVAGRYSVTWNEVMAATLVATIPVAALFSVLQRYLVRGLTLGAVK